MATWTASVPVVEANGWSEISTAARAHIAYTAEA